MASKNITLPRFIVIKSAGSSVYYDNGDVSFKGPKGVLVPEAKIEAEQATINDSYYNLRFCFSNKYWQKSTTDNSIVATSNKPQEDVSEPSCTLFEAVGSYPFMFNLIHVQTGDYVLSSPQADCTFYVGNTDPQTGDYIAVLFYVNWDTLVKLPQHIAFKGDNGKFLKAFYDDHYYMSFDSDDPNETASGHTLSQMLYGQVRINSVLSGMFWNLSPNWIWADSTDTTANDNRTLFLPFKIDNETIALKNAANNNFCKRLSVDGMEDCLNAAVPTMVQEAWLTVQELVSSRVISGVTYRMDDARIYGLTPYEAGTTTVANYADEDATLSVEMTYQNESSYSFTNSMSITAGVSNTITAGIPEIVDDTITVNVQIDKTMEWGTTTTTTTSVTATIAVSVPARSTSVVKYVGTKGTCDVPFNYTQEDTSSVDGSISTNQMSDGVFTGVNCYNFDFKVEPPVPISD